MDNKMTDIGIPRAIASTQHWHARILMVRRAWRRQIFITMLVVLVSACATGGDVSKPIPTSHFPATHPAHRLVVVLPGRGDDLASLERKGMTRIIQNAWPDTDVILTGLTMPFYRQGHATTRLQEEIITPAQASGYREIWLMGISLGGMGALMYEHDYPGRVRGILLLSPYLGNASIHDEVQRAGGLSRWNPGPSRPIGPDTVDHELWHTLKSLGEDPKRADAFWIAYGNDEPFRTPIERMTPILPPANVAMLPGRHNWKLWISAASVLLERIAHKQGEAGSNLERTP